MPFIDKTSILIENSLNKNISLFELENDIIYTNMDSQLNVISSNSIIDGKFSFVDIWLDIDNNENIYGILNNKKGLLQNLTINSNNLKKDTLIKYDPKNFLIKFPYTKTLKDESHIAYYSINKSNPYCAYLIHIYKSKNTIKKNRIDFINYNILSNFIILYNNNIPIIFYFKIINNAEELFISTFDTKTCTWSTPQQITNSNKGKIYLSVIKDNKDNFHIVFSENNNSNKYFCKYLCGSITKNTFSVYTEKYIHKHSMCVFPNLIYINSKIYIQWIEYFDLYYSESLDSGESWSEPKLNYLVSNLNFKRYEFRSNDKTYNASTIYALNDYKIIL